MAIAVERTNSRHIPVRPEWLARRLEPALEPELPIVDPHHHLWDVPDRPFRYFLDEFNADLASGHDIRATVFIECHAMYRKGGPDAMRTVGEVEFANGQAAASASGHYGSVRVADGIVGFAPLGMGAAVEPVLEAMERAAGPRFKGVRNISAWHKDPAARGSSANPPPDMLTNPLFVDGLEVLARRGHSFDAFMYHTQLSELAAVARKVPEASIVLDHCGGILGIGPYAGRRDATFAEWKAGMAEVAACPNVRVKLGGLGMRLFGYTVHEGELPPTSEDLANAWRPVIETTIELFGPRRAMFEGNFPVDKGSCSYGNLWNAFKRIAAGASAEEKDWLFRRTAAEAYRLEV